MKLADVPLSDLSATNCAVLAASSNGVVLDADPQLWSFSAIADIDLPGIETASCTIKIRLRVDRGTLGVGWLSDDSKHWVARSSAREGSQPSELALAIPSGTKGGRLIFDNWTAENQAARAEIESITLVGSPAALYRYGKNLEVNGHKDEAIAAYREILTDHPSHTMARAALGRLTFEEPDQPFIREMKERLDFDVTEIVVQIRNPCNYRCSYCVAAGSNNEPVKRLDLENIDKAFRQMSSRLIVTSFECGGGEPTVHPQFADLLRLCASYGPVSFPTNNSQKPERWLPKETAKRILIRSALHPESEEKMERYVRNARYLMEHGCEFRSTFVAHPDRMPRVAEYTEYFAKEQVPFTPVAFIGTHNGRRYPNAYTEEEKRMLGLHQETRSWLHRIEPHVTRIRNFRGIPCIAGRTSIYITKDGGLRRCVYDLERVLDKPLATSEPCGVSQCGCGLFLDRLNNVQSVDFYNYWAPKADVPTIDTGWLEGSARKLGYDGANDALSVEHTRMYDALMLAYGKDEFVE